MLKSQIVAALGLVVSSASLALAQAAGPIWVPLDTQPAGTPPSVVLDRLNSDEDQSTLIVTLHGFYYTPVPVPGVGPFRRIGLDTFDNLRKTMTPGRPELPVMTFKLGIPTNAASLGTPVFTSLASQTLTAYDVYPAQPDYVEEEGTLPEPPPPSHDAAFYAMNTTYPANSAAVEGSPEATYRVRGQCVTVNPFRANPGMRTLTVHNRFTIRVPHAGNASPPVEVTRRTERLLAQVFDNWALLNGFYVIPNEGTYRGEYLFVGPQSLINDAVFTPFLNHKAERGYKVTVKLTDLFGSTATDVYNSIDTWYNSRPAGADCYVILVGDTNHVPLGFSPRHNANVSDYAYACHPLGTESNQDLYLGRFSVSNTTELNRIVVRSIAYQDTPAQSNRYDNVLLAAHRQLSNGYVDCIEDIAAYGSYNGVQPSFILRRGSLNTGTVANVYTDTSNGQGIILYRGHGGGTSWSHWDFNSDSLDSADVTAMDLNFVRPVVFSVACTNSQIDRSGEPCISEVWHRKSGGAVAHLGGSRSTWTYANHTYAKNLIFWQFFPSPGLTLGSVIDLAGLFMAFNHEGCGWDNRYLYLLQGDPEIVAWRENPNQTGLTTGNLRGTLPQWYEPGLHGITLNYSMTDGTPIEGAIVALYKEGDVETNKYTDASGNVTFLFSLDTCGELSIRAYSDFEPVEAQRIVIPVAIEGDANHDGEVNFTDITEVLTFWTFSYPEILGQGDADFSNAVNFADITAVLRSWGESCNE